MKYKYPPSYVLPVEGPMMAIDAETKQTRMVYKEKQTGEYRTGWFHCGCCGKDGFASTKTPTCTNCANKLLHSTDDSPQSVEYIQAYCDYWNAELAKMSKE